MIEAQSHQINPELLDSQNSHELSESHDIIIRLLGNKTINPDNPETGFLSIISIETNRYIPVEQKILFARENPADDLRLVDETLGSYLDTRPELNQFSGRIAINGIFTRLCFTPERISLVAKSDDSAKIDTLVQETFETIGVDNLPSGLFVPFLEKVEQTPRNIVPKKRRALRGAPPVKPEDIKPINRPTESAFERWRRQISQETYELRSKGTKR